jgi:hypothetical protein
LASNLTVQTDGSISGFLAALPDARQRADAEAICAMMARVSGQAPKLWGRSIVGFGSYHYKYESGHQGDMARIGFSPRKANTVVYIVDGFAQYGAILARLGKFKSGKSCLYIKHLSDIDTTVLEDLVIHSYAAMQAKYPE